MKKFKNIIIGAIVICIIVGISIFISLQNGKNKFNIVEWDNLYNEKNIAFHFSESKNPKIKELNDRYKIKEATSKEDTTIKKVLKAVEYVNNIVTFDDVPNSQGINAYDIIQEKGNSKKTSARDMAIITRDFLKCLDLDARVGEFRKSTGNIKKQSNYYVVEYWSKSDNKWIMVDFIDYGYFENQGFLCSATELLGNDIRMLKYTGKSSQKDYMYKLKKSLESYTVAIDNTVEMKKSNSYITYIKGTDSITLDFKGTYLKPTIYTEELELINKNPIDNIKEEDKKAYIILMKKDDKNETEESKEKALIVGAFKNGSIMNEYYIKENNGDYKLIKKYSDIVLKPGENTIELSIDGKNTVSKIVIDYKE